MARHVLIGPTAGLALAAAAAMAATNEDAELMPIRQPRYEPTFETPRLMKLRHDPAPRSPRKSFKKSSKR